ncbi:MAG: type II toxin-antitoxin system YafQ family toxin [Candidatus Anammoxibacter sp.]
MLRIRRLTQFKKDYKKAEKQSKEMQALDDVIVRLATKQPLGRRFKDHKLVGVYKDYRECHIKSDWLLIYQVNETELVLIRTGSHADLFE